MEDGVDFLESFRQEGRELLAGVEDCVLLIEENGQDPEVVNKLFRAIHTIKGSGSMFGFVALTQFTHHLESVLDQVRSGTIEVDRELINIVLESRDQIAAMLERAPEDPAPDVARIERIQVALKKLSDPKVEKLVAPSEPEDGPGRYHIQFLPSSDIMATGMDPKMILEELRSLGECHIECDTSRIPPIEDLNPESCYLSWTIDLTTDVNMDTLRGVFMFVEEGSQISIERLEDEVTLAVVEGDLEPRANQPVATKTNHEADSVRVSSAKLDQLVNLIGELVINQAQLAQISSGLESYDLNGSVEQVERLVSELRDIVLSIRMMPIGTTFNRFRRLVRDLAGDLGKEMELVTEGGETELDKGVIDRLADPLVHLIRNSADHGIESPESRQLAGKPAKGRITLTASHQGANVVISVQDDGNGLHPDKIRAKAIERGIISPDANLSQQDIFGLIFEPGFSTAVAVTNVSGRGVGMDVVKREIDALRGSISISSEPGTGTRIDLTLPLTLAIIEGLLVKSSTGNFVLPLSVVEECLELNSSHYALGPGRNVLHVRDEAMPCVVLRDFFGLTHNRPVVEEAVVVRVDGGRFAIVVDQVVGDYQTVIKSLGKLCRNATGLSGATILGDGQVALILDAAELIHTAEREERAVCLA